MNPRNFQVGFKKLFIISFCYKVNFFTFEKMLNRNKTKLHD